MVVNQKSVGLSLIQFQNMLTVDVFLCLEICSAGTPMFFINDGFNYLTSSLKNKSWLGSLISTIIGNLKLSISNIHIRYEDLER